MVSVKRAAAALALVGSGLGCGQVAAATYPTHASKSAPLGVAVTALAGRFCNPYDWCVMVKVSDETSRPLSLAPSDFIINLGVTMAPVAAVTGWDNIPAGKTRDILLDFPSNGWAVTPIGVAWRLVGLSGETLTTMNVGTQWPYCSYKPGWSDCPFFYRHLTLTQKAGTPWPWPLNVGSGVVTTFTLVNEDDISYAFADPDLGLNFTLPAHSVRTVQFLPERMGQFPFTLTGPRGGTKYGSFSAVLTGLEGSLGFGLTDGNLPG
jgi:hypothetical protein